MAALDSKYQLRSFRCELYKYFKSNYSAIMTDVIRAKPFRKLLRVNKKERRASDTFAGCSALSSIPFVYNSNDYYLKKNNCNL